MKVIKDPKLHAALELLNAYAQEKKDDVTDIISEKYSSLKEALTRNAKTVAKENPWAVIGGLAAACLALGYFLGRLVKASRESSEEGDWGQDVS
jgi:ElaB/YqjD/DUF883 family membrane-anchored ribosome-binding protein